MYMEDPIVIPTAKSVQLTLQRSAHKIEQAVKLLQAEVNQKITDWQNELSKQSSLINILEELLKADLEALKAGKPPPEDSENQRKVLSTFSPKVAV